MRSIYVVPSRVGSKNRTTLEAHVHLTWDSHATTQKATRRPLFFSNAYIATAIDPDSYKSTSSVESGACSGVS